MQRVVAVLGIEADFDVVFAPAMMVEDAFHFAAKIAFDLKDDSADAAIRVVRLVGKDLFRVWVHAARGFSASDGTQNCDSGEQSPLRNDEPFGSFGRAGAARVVDLTEDQKQGLPLLRVWIAWKLSRDDARTELQGSDVERGKRSKVDHVWRCKKAHAIEPSKTLERVRRTDGDELQKEMSFGERPRVEKDHPRRHRERRGNEVARRENPAHHDLVVRSGAALCPSVCDLRCSRHLR